MNGRIQQFLWTHCTYDTSCAQRLGYGPRAGSLKDTSDLLERSRKVERLLYYELPRGTPGEQKLILDAEEAPRRLVYLPRIGGHQVLALVCYRAKDTSKERRTSSYFAHVIFNEQSADGPSWDTLDCLKLWWTPGLSSNRESGWDWIVEDSDTKTLGFELPELDGLPGPLPDETGPLCDEVLQSFLDTESGGKFVDPGAVIPPAWRKRPKSDRQQLVARVVATAADAVDNKVKLLLVAEDSFAALLFYAILRLYPPRHFPKPLSFSTFEPDPNRLITTLAATHFHADEGAFDPSSIHGDHRIIDTFNSDWKEADGPDTSYSSFIVEHLCQGGWSTVDEIHADLQPSDDEERVDLDVLAAAGSDAERLLDHMCSSTEKMDWESVPQARTFHRQAVVRELVRNEWWKQSGWVGSPAHLHALKTLCHPEAHPLEEPGRSQARELLKQLATSGEKQRQIEVLQSETILDDHRVTLAYHMFTSRPEEPLPAELSFLQESKPERLTKQHVLFKIVRALVITDPARQVADEKDPAEKHPAEVEPAEVESAEVEPAEVEPAEVEPADKDFCLLTRFIEVHGSESRHLLIAMAAVVLGHLEKDAGEREKNRKRPRVSQADILATVKELLQATVGSDEEFCQFLASDFGPRALESWPRKDSVVFQRGQDLLDRITQEPRHFTRNREALQTFVRAGYSGFSESLGAWNVLADALPVLARTRSVDLKFDEFSKLRAAIKKLDLLNWWSDLDDDVRIARSLKQLRGITRQVVSENRQVWAKNTWEKLVVPGLIVVGDTWKVKDRWYEFENSPYGGDFVQRHGSVADHVRKNVAKLSRRAKAVPVKSSKPGGRRKRDHSWLKKAAVVFLTIAGVALCIGLTVLAYDKWGPASNGTSVGAVTENESNVDAEKGETTTPPPESDLVDPKTDKPKTDKPKTDKPKTDKPKTDKPKTGKPKSGKPKSGKPKTGKPKSGKPKSGNPLIAQPADPHDYILPNVDDLSVKENKAQPIKPTTGGSQRIKLPLPYEAIKGIEIIASPDQGREFTWDYFHDMRKNEKQLQLKSKGNPQDLLLTIFVSKADASPISANQLAICAYKATTPDHLERLAWTALKIVLADHSKPVYVTLRPSGSEIIREPQMLGTLKRGESRLYASSSKRAIGESATVRPKGQHLRLKITGIADKTGQLVLKGQDLTEDSVALVYSINGKRAGRKNGELKLEPTRVAAERFNNQQERSKKKPRKRRKHPNEMITFKEVSASGSIKLMPEEVLLLQKFEKFLGPLPGTSENNERQRLFGGRNEGIKPQLDIVYKHKRVLFHGTKFKDNLKGPDGKVWATAIAVRQHYNEDLDKLSKNIKDVLDDYAKPKKSLGDLYLIGAVVFRLKDGESPIDIPVREFTSPKKSR